MEPEVFARWRVFVSYSHEDAKWIKPLRAHLSGLDLWIDELSIEPGDQWDPKIEKGLEETRVAVLLISARFLASAYVKRKELPYLLEAAETGQVTLLPIYVLPCEIPPELTELKRYEALHDLERTLADMEEPDQERVFMEAGKRSRTVLSELSERILVTAASEDRADAVKVLEGLGKQGLRFDFEEYDDIGDELLQTRVAAKLPRRRAALLFVGARGLGLWGVSAMRETLRREQEAMLREPVTRRPLISALLPRSPENLELPAFLPANTHVPLHRGLEDKASLDRLRVALEGKIASPLEVMPIPPSPSYDLERLAQRLLSENMTLFLGNDLAVSEKGDESEERPGAAELARALLEELEFMCPSCNRGFLPLDIAGTYFALSHGERSLEHKLCDLVSRNSKPSRTHRRIARFVRGLLENERSGRSLRRGPRRRRLIVTTNIDLLMERALLEQGVPFVRLVQDKSGEKIVVNEYRSVTTLPERRQLVVRTGDEEETVHDDDVEGLFELITTFGNKEYDYRESKNRTDVHDTSQNPLRTLALERFEPQVFLYKLHGSDGVPHSCAISTDQHFQFLKSVLEKNVIPLKITEWLSSGPVLVLGYSFLDPSFRVLVHTLPIEAAAGLGDSGRRYLLRLPPGEEDPDDFHRLEKRLWDKITGVAVRHGISVIERPGDLFLDELIKALDGRQGGG